MSYSWKSRDDCNDEKSKKNELDSTKSITSPSNATSNNNNMKSEEKSTSEKIESEDQINPKSTTINNYEKNSDTNSSSNVKSKPNKKKRKKQKEEKEDGELDDENESMEESQHDENHEYEDDDYEDYDMDDDSHEDLNKKPDTADSGVSKSTDPAIESEKSSVINTATIISKAEDLKDFNENLKLSVTTNPPEITFNPKTTTSSTSCSSTRASTNVPVVSGNTIQYDLEEEDDDDDDDEYGNSKRLKIDEESEIVDEKPSVEHEPKVSQEIKPITITKKEEETNTKLNLNDASSSNKTSSLLEQQHQSNQIYSENNSSNKQIDLDNDNDSSSSMSSKSSVSTSSALTAISTISSDSLPISSTSSITCDSKPITSNNYEAANSEINQQHESNSENVESSSSENNSNIKKLEDSKSGQQKPTAIDLQSIESLKVPPLKIIYSNSHGGHPYVKSDPNEGKTRNKKSKKESNDASSGSDTQTKTEDDTSNQGSKSQSESDTPASNSRSKASKITISNNRVGSPVPTALSGNITSKTTPTRRSAAASALAGRSSPAQNSFASLNQQNTKKTSDSNTSTNNPSTAINQSAVNDNSNNGLNMVNSNEMENVIRRKLRSHTRQLQTGDVFEPIGRSQLNIITKSPSPLTILSENANSYNTTEPYGVEPQQAVSSNQQPSENNKGSDHSNDSHVDSSDSATNIGSGNQDPAQPARKKRNRQQAQSENLTTSSAANDSSEAIQSHSLSHQTNSEAIASCNSSIDSTASINSNLNLLNQVSSSQLATSEQPTISATNTHSTQQPSVLYNCIRKFLDLRNEISKKRDTSMEMRYEVKMPKNYQDFTLFKKNYLIKSNKEVRQSISFFKPPNDMPDDLKEYFFKQEKDRHSLRLRHRIEQDKLIILYEQEILRSFNNRCSGQVSANQSIPYSFCSIVKDDEVYSTFGRLNEQIIGSSSDQQQQHHQQQQQNQNDPCVLLRLDSQNTEEKFIQNLENLKIKFQKLKEDLVKRQLNESDSLQAVQKMDFQACIRELLNKYKTAATASVKNPTNSTIANTNSSLANYNLISQFQQTNIANCVPIVHVNFNKIDLFDVSHIYSPSNSSNAAVSVSS